MIEAPEQCSIKHETFCKLVPAAGMRRGEACGLTWSDIDRREHCGAYPPQCGKGIPQGYGGKGTQTPRR